MLVTDQTPGPNIRCKLDFVDNVTHEINENYYLTKNSGFTVTCADLTGLSGSMLFAKEFGHHFHTKWLIFLF